MLRSKKYLILSLSSSLIVLFLVAIIILVNKPSENQNQNLLDYLIHHVEVKQCKFSGEGGDPLLPRLDRNDYVTYEICRGTFIGEPRDEIKMKCQGQWDSWIDALGNAMNKYRLKTRQIREIYFGIPVTKQFCPDRYEIIR